MDIKARLEEEVAKRDCLEELSAQKPDPIMIAREYRDEYSSLICALFAYGNAGLIVKFLESLDFSLFEMSDEKIQIICASKYYRFQKSEDVSQFFITLKRAQNAFSLEEKFVEGYRQNEDVLDGLAVLIDALQKLNNFESYGYRFLLGKVPSKKSTSTYKRWLMYLRWMVRRDNIDMGLWKNVDKKDLLIPLDTHTFNVSQSLGLLKRKQYDLKAVLELSETLRAFDPHDPAKYDFALYRLGQEKLI